LPADRWHILCSHKTLEDVNKIVKKSKADEAGE